MTSSPTTENPREAEAKPPFPQESLEYPGLEPEKTPRPDYGEESYQGHGRLQGKVALITGGNSGIGRVDQSVANCQYFSRDTLKGGFTGGGEQPCLPV